MRRAMVLLGVAAAALVPASPAGAQATAFQADPAHTGFVRTGGPPSPPLRRAWIRRLPAGSSYPVIAERKVFVVAAKAHGRGAQVLALSARTGRTVWRRDLGPYGGGHPAYDRGHLYVARGSEDGLLAFSAASGRLVWQRRGDLSVGTPVASDGVVYATSSHGIGAYRGSDGESLWRVIGNSSTPAVAGGAVYASLDCGRAALSRGTGRLLWETEGQFCSSDTFAVHDGRVYVRENFEVPPGDVYDAATGAVVGSMRSDYAPAFAGRVGVFADGRLPPGDFLHGHTLVARSLPGGRARWRFDGDGYLDTAPLIVGRTVYVGSGSGRVYGLSLRRGRVVWRARLSRPVLGSNEATGIVKGLAAGAGVLVVPAYGQLVAFR